MKFNAIVLRSIKYGEHDTITYLYTRQQGRQTCILHGARKPAARQKSSLLQPLFLLDIEIHPPKRKSSMCIIKELKMQTPLPHLAADPQKMAIALFISETLYRFIKEEESNESLYAFLEANILHLDRIRQGAANFHLYFMAQFAQHLGFLPCNDYHPQERRWFDISTGRFVNAAARLQCMDEASSLLLWQLLQCGTDGLAQFEISRQMRTTLLQGLLEYYSFHLGMKNPVRSLSVLQEIFA